MAPALGDFLHAFVTCARRTKLSKHIVSLTSSLKPQVEEEALVFTFGGATAAADGSPGTGDAAEDNKKVQAAPQKHHL